MTEQACLNLFGWWTPLVDLIRLLIAGDIGESDFFGFVGRKEKEE